MVFATTHVTFPALSIAAFADPTFDADFRRLYKQQTAASAGVQPKDVVIESIRAGSVAVQVRVPFRVFPCPASSAAGLRARKLAK